MENQTATTYIHRRLTEPAAVMKLTLLADRAMQKYHKHTFQTYQTKVASQMYRWSLVRRHTV